MIYKKWRELIIDPYTVKYKNIKLKEIISYLPAGNDVLECIANYDNKEVNLIIKFERSKMADFESEYRTIIDLQKTQFRNLIPKVIENGIIDQKRYLVLEKKEGKRLSEILKNKRVEKQKYLYKYGRSLAGFHLLPTKEVPFAKQRVINDIPTQEIYPIIDSKIKPYIEELKKTKPQIEMDTFIHGDYHYANILWRYGSISGILDFEYSGIGFKEQDIAWSLVLRPTQKFMNKLEDIQEFLKGYKSKNNYDEKKLKWCLINAYCHFYLMNQQNTEYKRIILDLIGKIKRNVL